MSFKNKRIISVITLHHIISSESINNNGQLYKLVLIQNTQRNKYYQIQILRLAIQLASKAPEYPEYPDNITLGCPCGKFVGTQSLEGNNKLRVSHGDWCEIVKQLFFKINNGKTLMSIRNAFGKWNYHKTSHHTHNANT